VKNDLIRLFVWSALVSNTKPAMSVIGALIRFCLYGVGEGEKAFALIGIALSLLE